MSDAQVPAVERRSRVAPSLKGVERAKLLDELAALHEAIRATLRRSAAPPSRLCEPRSTPDGMKPAELWKQAGPAGPARRR